MKKLKAKLRSARGMTLIELLAATAVIILLSLMINTGLNLALRSYHRMISESETQLLLSTVVDKLSEELRYARNVETDGDGRLTQYRSETYGYYSNIIISEEADEDSYNGGTSDGQLLIEVAGVGEPLLASGVYGKDSVYKVELPGGIRYNRENGTFSLTVRVYEDGVSDAETDLTVLCLNAEKT